MNAAMVRLLLLAPFFVTTMFAHASVHAQSLLVGAAQVDITPPVGFRTGGGYGEVISTAVDDPLFAKAIVLQQGDQAAAIVISDLLSVPPDLSHLAREAASNRTRIPIEHIVVAATHDHGSPEYWGSLRDIAHQSAVKQHGHDPHERIDYYLPTQRSFEEGSYEVTTCPLDPGCGEILLAAARGALSELQHE